MPLGNEYHGGVTVKHPWKVPRPCKRCEREFTPTHHNQRYCTKACQHKKELHRMKQNYLKSRAGSVSQ